MVEESLPVDLRRDRIAALVQERGFVRVAELSRIFRISPVTIRTDLDELDSRNAIRRVHGGAVSNSGELSGVRAPAEDPMSAERARICTAAASIVSSGQTVVIAGAPATRTVGRALAQRRELEGVVVITNDLRIALDLSPAVPRFTVVVTGGTLRAGGSELGDPLGGVVLDDVTADLSIFGCAGITADRGVTGSSVLTVEMARRLLRAGTRAVTVADSQQVGAVGPARLAIAEEIDVLITGAQARSDELARLRDRGIDVKVVD